MISSRELSRRNFCYAFLLGGAVAVDQKSLLKLPKRRFELGSRVKSIWTCTDRISPNFGTEQWECGLVIGYFWQYPNWLKSEFESGWTYWIRFDDSSDREYFFEPYTDFVHETQLAIT